MDHSSFRWVLRKIRHRIPSIMVLTFLQAANAFLGVMFALGSKAVIDGAISAEPAVFRAACIRQLLIVLGILLTVGLVRHLRERLAAQLERDWKKQLLHGLLHGEYSKVAAYHSGDLLNRLNNDVTKVNDGVLNIFPAFAAMIVRLVAAVVILGVLDLRFALVAVSLGVIVVLVTGVLRRYMKQLHSKVSQMDGRVSGWIQESIEKLLMIQAMSVAPEVERRTEKLLDHRYEIQRKRKNISVAANTAVNIMAYGSGFLALLWCATGVMQGTMSFGSLTAIIQLVNQLQRPFVDLSGVLPQYTAMLASGERLMELDKIQGEPALISVPAEEMYREMDSICVENLTFSYDREKILSDVSFSLPKDAFAVVIGPSGTGKSTLLKMLLGVYPPEKGDLFVQSTRGRYELNRSTRHLFAYVPQGNLLFSGTLRDNLTIVRPEATEAEIQQAVYASAMDSFLPQLPFGLDTDLGENGAGLSEGQAQRLAIARAVLCGAPVLLLDECTSALDEQTEWTVLERLRQLPDRTCITVSHRPAAITLCDWQLDLSDGNVTVMKQ